MNYQLKEIRLDKLNIPTETLRKSSFPANDEKLKKSLSWLMKLIYNIIIITILLISLQSLISHTKLSKTKYKRSNWQHWIDADKDCQNTRNEVLIRDSLKPVTFKSSKKCKVASGLWKCPYTGKIFTNPRKLDIDHVVPLKEAYLSGAYTWNKSKKKVFANDLQNPHHLLAVEAKANRTKGAKDPANWLPSLAECKYIKIWIQIKNNYNLGTDKVENRIIKEYTNKCRKTQTNSKKS